MSLRRVKDPDTLFAEVAEYDRVLVPDPALASALNRRLDEPHFGPFASTPRRLAAGGREKGEDRKAFLSVFQAIDADWPEIADTVGNVLQCWDHTGDIRTILSFDQYRDETTRAVVEQLRSVETTSRRLSRFEFDHDISVAVIGSSAMTTLEQGMIPPTATEISIFTDDTRSLPHVARFSTDTEIIKTIISHLDEETAQDVAVVVGKGSSLAIGLESAFEAKQLPYYGGPGFIDEPHHRVFLELLHVGFGGSEIRIRDVEPLLTHVGFEVPIADLEKHVSSVDVPGVTWLRNIRQTIATQSFSVLLNTYEEAIGEDLPSFHRELETLELHGKPITQRRIDQLGYYLKRYDVPVSRENEGVLLVDAKTSAFVDRSTVLFVGLDETWVPTTHARPWITSEETYDRNLDRFERLLQSGDARYYIVKDSAGGEAVQPCQYFTDLTGQPCESFADLPNDRYSKRASAGSGGFPTPSQSVSPITIETISQSSLNTYVNCPQDYLYDRILPGPERAYFVRGSVLHDFAELYVERPDIVQDTAEEDLVQLCVDQEHPFIPERNKPLARRTYAIGMCVIQAYLDAFPPQPVKFDDGVGRFGKNIFAEAFDITIDSTRTEHRFENDTLGISGLIDLIRSPTEIVDYKSGSKKRLRKLVRRGRVDPMPETPNFQASLYLTYLRERTPDETLQFTFVHFLEPMNEAITGNTTIGDALCEIGYEPESFQSFVASEKAFEILLDGYNDCRETFEALGRPTFQAIMAERDFPQTTDINEIRDTPFYTEFTESVVAQTNDSVDAEKGSDQAIRALNDVRAKRFFKNDLDEFSQFVSDTILEINRRRSGIEPFPVHGPSGEPNYRRVSNRDLLLEGEE